jgi:hypothetical protein
MAHLALNDGMLHDAGRTVPHGRPEELGAWAGGWGFFRGLPRGADKTYNPRRSQNVSRAP